MSHASKSRILQSLNISGISFKSEMDCYILFLNCLYPTSGRAALGSKLVDGMYQVQFPIAVVDLAVRSIP